MRIRATMLLLAAATLLCSPGIMAQAPQPENPLQSLEWLVGDTLASETKRPTGQVLIVEAKYEWASEKKAIKFSSTYKSDGKSILVSEGTYFWHPGKKQVLMLQTGSGLTESVVQQQDDGLLHDNTLTRANGSTDRQRALFVREGDDKFLLKASVLNKEDWQEVITFTYHRRREGTPALTASASPTTVAKVEPSAKVATPPTKVSDAAAAWKVADLQWLTGAWRERKPGVETEEQWIAPKGEFLLGVNRTTRDSNRNSFEFLRIAKTASGISYFASPAGRAATEFRLIDVDKEKIVFENLEHDFPQRIIYWMSNDGTLNARIEGTIGGKSRSQEWHWESVSTK